MTSPFTYILHEACHVLHEFQNFLKYFLPCQNGELPPKRRAAPIVQRTTPSSTTPFTYILREGSDVLHEFQKFLKYFSPGQNGKLPPKRRAAPYSAANDAFVNNAIHLHIARGASCAARISNFFDFFYFPPKSARVSRPPSMARARHAPMIPA